MKLRTNTSERAFPRLRTYTLIDRPLLNVSRRVKRTRAANGYVTTSSQPSESDHVSVTLFESPPRSVRVAFNRAQSPREVAVVLKIKVINPTQSREQANWDCNVDHGHGHRIKHPEPFRDARRFVGRVLESCVSGCECCALSLYMLVI